MYVGKVNQYLFLGDFHITIYANIHKTFVKNKNKKDGNLMKNYDSIFLSSGGLRCTHT